MTPRGLRVLLTPESSVDEIVLSGRKAPELQRRSEELDRLKKELAEFHEERAKLREENR